MKIMTILGTRPEIIRLSRVIPFLDKICNHILVHTGQNYETSLSQLFFEELGLRDPDHLFASKSPTTMGQIGLILQQCEQIMDRERPDRILILGDTNSALSAFVAKRMGISVYHMEAGNRCFDDRVPEEVNRRVVDHSSDVLMPYTEWSRRNLIQEGIPVNRIHVTGNPIKEVLDFYEDRINGSTILNTLSLSPGGFFLATLHRAENVDIPERLEAFMEALNRICREKRLPLICLVHPRTRSKLSSLMLEKNKNHIRFIDPLGLFDFVHLEKHAACVLTDSGTVQEECCIFNIPSVTLRDTTERPETIEAGSNILSGVDSDDILRCLNLVLDSPNTWDVPSGYLAPHVSRTVAKIVTGYRAI